MAKYVAKGTLLKIGDGGGTELFTTILNVKSIDGPSVSTDFVDVTDHSSGNFKEKKPAHIDPGQVTFEVNYDPADATHSDAAGGLIADMVAQTLRNFEIVWTDSANTKFGVSGYVKDFGPNAPSDGALTANLVLELTGAIDFSKA